MCNEVITITRGYTISTWNLMVIDYLSIVVEQAMRLFHPSGAMPEVLRIVDPHVSQTLSLPD